MILIKVKNQLEQNEYAKLDRVRRFIDATMTKNSFSTNNKLTSTDKAKPWYSDKYHEKKQRSMICSQTSKLALCLLGPKYEIVRCKFYLSDGQTTHSIIRNIKTLNVIDFTASQFESIEHKPLDYSSDFKPIKTGMIDGFFHMRYRKFKSQELGFRFPSKSVLKYLLKNSNALIEYKLEYALRYRYMFLEFMEKIEKYYYGSEL